MIDVRGLHHLGLTVADVDASCDYFATAGYALRDRLRLTGPDGAIANGLADATLDIAFVSAPELTLELVQFSPSDPRPVAEGDPSFGSVPAWAAGVPPVDPDGRPVTVGGSLVDIRVTSSDPDDTARLLGVLGFTESDGGSLLGHGARLEIVQVASGRIVSANSPGRVHVCCEITDMDAACAELAEQGYGLVSTPRIHENLAWVFVSHPSGPGIELLSVGAS